MLLFLPGLGEVTIESVESALPELAVARDPGGSFGQRRGLEAAATHPPVLLGLDEAGPLEDVDVLEDRRQRHGERPRELAHGGLGLREPDQDGPARRVGQSPERGVEPALIVNHQVKY